MTRKEFEARPEVRERARLAQRDLDAYRSKSKKAQSTKKKGASRKARPAKMTRLADVENVHVKKRRSSPKPRLKPMAFGKKKKRRSSRSRSSSEVMKFVKGVPPLAWVGAAAGTGLLLYLVFKK